MTAIQAPQHVATPVVNVAVYKFVPLTRLDQRRQQLLQQCRGWQLKGTILLSPEGINLFVAGARRSTEQLLATLASDPEIGTLEVKQSLNAYQPFSRMLVKIKKEIIAFGVAGIDPAREPAPSIEARQLHQWLDEGRPCTLLDVRNDYEVRLGTFRGAQSLGIDHFRQFPASVERLPEQWKHEPVVTFCTGGIRCEKGGPLMQRAGFEDVYQLRGGILKYFEQCGQGHFQGECFVFDKRTAVDSQLQETATTLCYACQSPLTVEEQRSPHYVPSTSCPYCYDRRPDRR